MIKMKLKADYREMVRIEKKVQSNCDEAVVETAEALAKYIRAHWTPGSPPAPVGKPPARDTKNMDSAVRYDSTGRDEKGKYRNKKDASVAFVKIDTEQGDKPNGRGQYARAVQERPGFERPFIEPAIEALQPVYVNILKRKKLR